MSMKTELLQPAATILAALIASRPRGGQELQSAELQERFVAVFKDLQAACDTIERSKPPPNDKADVL
jgi:hypothetical protein